MHSPKPCSVQITSLWPIISNKYEYCCKVWLSTTAKVDVCSFLWMFMLSLLQKGSQEAVLQGHHSSTAQVPHWQRQFPRSPLCSQHTSVWSETFSFSALIYLLPAYSICLCSTSVSKLLQLSVLLEFILLTNLQAMILSGVLSFQPSPPTWTVQQPFSAYRIICFYFS